VVSELRPRQAESKAIRGVVVAVGVVVIEAGQSAGDRVPKFQVPPDLVAVLLSGLPVLGFTQESSPCPGANPYAALIVVVRCERMFAVVQYGVQES